MAHVEKYYHQFCNPSGQICRISIQKRGYTGSSIELEGQPDPITITYDNSDEFKFKAIIPSTADIFLTFGTGNGVDFSDFWEADEKTFKIVYTINGQIEWTGFVMLEGFAYELSGGVYYAQITATDGLGTLESILFKDQSTNRPYGFQDLFYNDGYEFPFILIATEILRKLELDLDLWTLVDVYEQNQTDRTSDSRDSDPLAITYVNVKTYINTSDRKDIPYFEDANEVWDCKKVMENLLNVMCGSQLFQENGVWKIKRMGVDAKYGIDNPIKLNDNSYLHQASYTDGSNQTALTVKDYIFDKNLNIYSSSETYANGDLVSNEEGGATAEDGYYKIKGIGKIIRVISNEIRGVITYDAPVYKWHKYNTLAGHIGTEEIDNEVVIPCRDSEQFLLGNDHVLKMDDVYKQFRVNYEYSFLREGDSPDNLIRNGNFEKYYKQYGQLESPPEWARIKWGKKPWYPRLRVDDIPVVEQPLAGRNTKALTMGRQYKDRNEAGKFTSSRAFSAVRQTGIKVNDTTNISTLTVWAKYRYKVYNYKMYPTFRLFFYSKGSGPSLLVNDSENKHNLNLRTRWDTMYSTKLTKYNSDGSGDLKTYEPKDYHLNGHSKAPDFFRLNAPDAVNYDKNEDKEYKWYKFSVELPPFPTIGELAVYIYGLTISKKKNGFGTRADMFKTWGNSSAQNLYGTNNRWADQGHGVYERLQIASINIGYKPVEGEEIPSEDYIYANENINFTDQRDPIEIFNGDTEDVVVLSSLIVPANTTGKKNKWDTSDNEFGKSDLGLILCKSVMSEYGKPSRLLEGSIKCKNASYGSKFKFEALPNLSFILLRGTFNPIRGYIEDATFAEINESVIKRGGIINGESLDPQWSDTGNVRCLKKNGVNDGYYEEEQIDTNPNSESFEDLKWVIREQDTELCPIGTPSKYYWGCDDANYQLSNFKDYTVVSEEGNSVAVGYTQEGGKYIYFLHLASLGVINRVANEFQYNIIDSFQYLADVTINGYLYRILRQDYITSSMDEFQQIFYFND